MKHTLYISSLLAACMLLFSCASDNTVVPGDGSSKFAVVNLSLSTGAVTRANGALPTDNGAVVGSNEGTLNHICVALFDANNKLVTLHEYDYSGDENISTRTDAVQMLIFSNVPVGAFAGKYILSDFYTVAQDLGYTTSVNGKSNTGVTTANSQSMKSLPMMSDVQTLNWGSGTTLSPTVTLNRMVARVALTNITYSFTGSYTGCTFAPTEIFMYNASNQLTNWNTKTVSGNVSGENIAGNANTAYLGSGTISTYSGPYYFYVFPHGSTSPTKLVIKGTFKTNSGTTYTTYYPIIVNSSLTGNIASTMVTGTGDSKISANTTYGLSVTISGTGVNSVSDELAATNVTVTTSVDSYTNATISEIYPIPHVGDIYYSDGSYSSTYNSSKTPIGIIVNTNPNYCEAANGYGHGLVMALKNASAGTPWKTENTTGGLSYVAVLSKMYTDVSGLNNSKIITMASSTYPAFYAVGTYTTSVSTPPTSSGWFLPSIGQWWDTLEKAVAYNNTSLGISLKHSDSTDAAYTGAGEDVIVANALTYLLTSHSLPSSLYTTFSTGMWYWSSSESSAANACHIAFYNNTFALYGTGKYDAGGRVRSFLAF